MLAAQQQGGNGSAQAAHDVSGDHPDHALLLLHELSKNIQEE